MDYMYSGLILVVDLDEGETEEIDLEEEFIRENLGGAAANLDLYAQHEDSIIIGSGFFTSTLVPGSACSVVTARSPISGRVCHAPLVWFAGSELKLSGYDFVVIKGKAKEPVYLWLHDEMADINDVSDLWGKDAWETTDYIREELGDERIQVLCIGKAGENKIKYAQIINNYWGSGDKHGFGALLGEKKLKAIAMRGMGELDVEDPDTFLEKAADLFSKIKEVIKGRKGFEWIVSELNTGIEGLDQFTHKYDACFSCPYACRAFVKYNELPSVVSSMGIDEPGILVSDLSGLLEFNKKLPMEDSLRAIELCCRLGIDQSVAASLIKGTKYEEAEKELETIATSVSEVPFSVKPWGKEFDYGVFSPSTPPLPVENWKERVALAYVLGICPTLSLLVPELSKERLVELINISAGWDISTDDLDRVIKSIFGG
jgi:aldehyde:ferredoxin oxidoreductase